jgi:autotransporter-associated beta strand protein
VLFKTTYTSTTTLDTGAAVDWAGLMVTSGSGTLLKEGAFTGLTVGSLTSFTGTLSVQAGSVTTSAANQLTGNFGVSLATGGTLRLGGNETLPTNMNSGLGTVEILQSSTVTITNAAARTVDRFFTGAGSLSKTGTGTLTLSGSNDYSGGTTIAGSNVGSGNTLDVNGATLANAIVVSYINSGANDGSGALQNTNTSTAAVLNGSVVFGGQNYVGGDGSIVFNGVVSGGTNNVYSLYKQGAGTWTYANTGNTFDGYDYQVDGVTEVTKLANLNEPSSLGQPTTSGRNRVSFGFNGAGGGTLRFIGGAASTSDRAFVLAGGTAASSTVIEASGTSQAATLTPTGGLSANRAGTYAATLGGTNAGVNVYAGTIGNGSATSVAIVKDGPTTWALTGTSTYTGPTTVAAGRLSVNGILGTTPVAVLAAAELGGSGAIGGPVSVAAGGTLAPGNSIASLATGIASFAAGATFGYEVDSSLTGSLGVAADLLVVSGGLNLDAGNGTLLSFTDLNSSPQPFVDTTTIFALINYSGAWNGGRFTVGSQQWEIDYDSPTGGVNYTGDYLPSSSFVTVTAVPEPATLVLLAAGAGLAVGQWSWRRNHQPARSCTSSTARPVRGSWVIACTAPKARLATKPENLLPTCIRPKVTPDRPSGASAAIDARSTLWMPPSTRASSTARA